MLGWLPPLRLASDLGPPRVSSQGHLLLETESFHFSLRRLAPGLVQPAPVPAIMIGLSVTTEGAAAAFESAFFPGRDEDDRGNDFTA